MNFRRGAVVAAMGAVLAIGACAPAAIAPASGPVLSPSGEPYAPGIRPRDTRQSGQIQLYLVQAGTAPGERATQLYRQALETAQQAMQTDSTNAIYHFLAAQAHVGLGDFQAANTHFERAEQIYPAYELEIDPAREQAWAIAFNRGIEAYQADNMAGATTAWQQANLIYDRRSEASLNLAIVHTQSQNYDAAVASYREALAALDRRPARQLTEEEAQERVESRETILENYAQLLVFTERFADAERLYRQMLESQPNNIQAQSALAIAVSRQGRADEARQIYDRLLGQPNLGADELFAVGVGLFNAQDYERSAQAFRRVTEVQANNRDAWYNLLNALYAARRHADLIPVGQRMAEIDPLNRNVHAILAGAHRETRQNQQALRVLEAAGALPVYIGDLEFAPRPEQATVRGTVEGNRARAGAPIRLEFTFFGAAGPIGTSTVTVNAPAEGQTARFEVTQQGGPAIGYRYRLLQ